MKLMDLTTNAVLLAVAEARDIDCWSLVECSNDGDALAIKVCNLALSLVKNEPDLVYQAQLAVETFRQSPAFAGLKQAAVALMAEAKTN